MSLFTTQSVHAGVRSSSSLSSSSIVKGWQGFRGRTPANWGSPCSFEISSIIKGAFPAPKLRNNLKNGKLKTQPCQHEYTHTKCSSLAESIARHRLVLGGRAGLRTRKYFSSLPQPEHQMAPYLGTMTLANPYFLSVVVKQNSRISHNDQVHPELLDFTHSEPSGRAQSAAPIRPSMHRRLKYNEIDRWPDLGLRVLALKHSVESAIVSWVRALGLNHCRLTLISLPSTSPLLGFEPHGPSQRPVCFKSQGPAKVLG